MRGSLALMGRCPQDDRKFAHAGYCNLGLCISIEIPNCPRRLYCRASPSACVSCDSFCSVSLFCLSCLSLFGNLASEMWVRERRWIVEKNGPSFLLTTLVIFSCPTITAEAHSSGRLFVSVRMKTLTLCLTIAVTFSMFFLKSLIATDGYPASFPAQLNPGWILHRFVFLLRIALIDTLDPDADPPKNCRHRLPMSPVEENDVSEFRPLFFQHSRSLFARWSPESRSLLQSSHLSLQQRVCRK
jgi:hypothetical protein